MSFCFSGRRPNFSGDSFVAYSLDSVVRKVQKRRRVDAKRVRFVDAMVGSNLVMPAAVGVGKRLELEIYMVDGDGRMAGDGHVFM